jgi:NAD(P)-dependent dehydrogenase (short-subunit alcohol dehydrogenase family)
MAAPLVRGYADSVALVAGGTSGVGLASAIGFADAGVRRIALLARNPERGEAARQAVLARCPEAEVLFVSVDAGDAGQVREAVAAVHGRFGQIDVAVSSVTGSYRPELLHRTPVEDKVAALEAKRNGVRVNALTPSLIANTPTAAMVLRDGFSRKLFEKAASAAHLGVAEPEDLASMVVFLGGPGAAKLTGQAISVNGGISVW